MISIEIQSQEDWLCKEQLMWAEILERNDMSVLKYECQFGIEPPDAKELIKLKVFSDRASAACHFPDSFSGRETPSFRQEHAAVVEAASDSKHPLPIWFSNRNSGRGYPMHVQYLAMFEVWSKFEDQVKAAYKFDLPLRVAQDNDGARGRRSAVSSAWSKVVLVLHICSLCWFVFFKDIWLFNFFGLELSSDSAGNYYADQTPLDKVLHALGWLSCTAFRVLVFVLFVHGRYRINK